MASEGDFVFEFYRARREPRMTLGNELRRAVQRGAWRRFGDRGAPDEGVGYCAIGHASMGRGDRALETDRLLTAYMLKGAKP
jgi:hypothetical protein